MTIKQHGGIFGRNPTFNDVSVEGDITLDGVAIPNPSTILVDGDIGSIASQDADNVDIDGGAIDGTPIGASTASTGEFTSVVVTSSADVPAKIVDPTNYGSSPGASPAGLNVKLAFEGDINSGFGSVTNIDEMAYLRLAYQDTAVSNSSVQGRGRLYVGTSTGAGGAAPADDKFYFDYNGDFALMQGNLVVASGKGIDFSATSGTGTSELFDDYEEGTWTVELYDASSAGSQSPTTATGDYTKVGNKVFANFLINNISTSGMSSGGTLHFSLPFAAGGFNGAAVGSARLDNVAFDAGRTFAAAQVSSNATRGSIVLSGDDIGDIAVRVTNITSGTSDILVSVTYFT